MPKTKTKADPGLAATKPYASHGAQFETTTNGQAIGECPLCGKGRHFYVNLAERPHPTRPGRTIDAGAFNCKSCGAAGGVLKFLELYHDQALSNTTEEDYANLSALRQIPAAALQSAKLAFDGRRWLLPLKDFSGKIRNLYHWDPKAAKPKLLSTASCQTSLYYPGELPPPETDPDWPIYLAEGEWDAIALEALRKKAKVDALILAVHGANTFDSSLTKYFVGRDVTLLYDNDDAGRSGVDKHGPMLATAGVKSISYLDWSQLAMPDDAEKWDIRDHLALQLAEKKKSKVLWAEIMGACVPHSSPVEEQPKEYSPPVRNVATVESFEEIIKGYRNRLHLTDNMIDGIAVIFATAFSGRTYGDPLWLFVVGPPGSGKSAIVKSFRESPSCKYTSTFKPRALVSGMDVDGEDPSLLKQWPQQAVFVKDFTAVKSLPAMEQEEIYGILRDAFDGHFHRKFGSGIERNYPKCYFSLICGVTDVIHNDARAELGERFLKFDWIRDSNYDSRSQIEAALATTTGEEEGDDQLIETSIAFMQREFDYDKTPQPNKDYQNRIIALAQIAAYLRTRKHGRGHLSDMPYRLRAEIPTRIARQLLKLGRCLAFVFGEKKWTPRVFNVLHNVAFDTCFGRAAEIFKVLAAGGDYTNDELEACLKFSKSSINRCLAEMVEIGYITRRAGEGRTKGHYHYYLTKESESLWEAAQPLNS